EIHFAVAAHDIDALIAEFVVGRLREGRGVEPAVECAVAGWQVRIAQNVGAQTAGRECISGIGLRGNRERGGSLYRHDRSNGPATYNMPGRTTGYKRTSLTE